MSQFTPSSPGDRVESDTSRNRVMGTGLMPDLVRAFDWASTPLGPIELWSDTLVASINQVLFSPVPAILCWGPDFIIFYNEAAIPALQGKHPQALGACYREVYREVWHLVGSDLENCFFRGQTVVRENRLIPLLIDGILQNGYFTYYLTPVFEDGQIAGIYDAYQNTTEAVLARRERDAVAAQLDQYLSATTDAIVGVNRDWTISYLNPEAIKSYSRGRQLIGKNMWDQFPEAVYEGSPFYDFCVRAMNERTPGSFEAHYPEPLDTWIQLEVYPTADGIVTFSRNISVHKQTEAALLQSEKLAAVGRLASSIAHEINNPLESVTNLLYLARTTVNTSSLDEYLDCAERELRRVSAITNQTLRFYKQTTRAAAAHCAALFTETLSIYQGRFSNTNIHVEIRHRANRAVVCFEGEIRQVLSNLIANAIDAMPPAGGRILLRSREATNWITGQKHLAITIADTGSGMPPQVRKRIFEAFFSTKGIGGTGLGLWVSKEIIDRHRGRLLVRSSQRQTTQGTVFVLFLPFEGPADVMSDGMHGTPSMR